jgi:hypothetical protein
MLYDQATFRCLSIQPAQAFFSLSHDHSRNQPDILATLQWN